MLTSTSLKENVEQLQNEGYEYIVKAVDKVLSGWGLAENCNHVQLIAAKNEKDARTIIDYLQSCNEFSYIKLYLTDFDKENLIKNYANKSFTLRDSFPIAFQH